MTSEMTPSGIFASTFGLDAYIGFGSYNEESTYAVYRIQVAKIVVTTVKYIMRTTFHKESQTSLLYREY